MPTLVNEVRDENYEPEKTGIRDGGSVDVICDTCRTPLLIIQITRPDFKFADGTVYENDYKVKCYKCGNFSKTHHIVGGIHYTNIAEINPNNGQERLVCFMCGNDVIDDIVILYTKKWVER